MTENKLMWIYGSRKGQTYDDNTKYLYEYMIEMHPEIESVWLTKNKDVFQYLTKKNMPVYMTESKEGIKCIKRASKAFINITYQDIDAKLLRENNSDVIQLWHGTPMKKNNIAVFNEKYKFVSLASEEFMINQELGTRELFDFRLTGYPRNDILLNAKLPTHINKETINILKAKIVISFLPTYNEEKDNNKNGTDKRGRAYDIWNDLDFHRLESFLIDSNAIFVFKLHALQSLNESVIMDKMIKSDHFIFCDPDDPCTDVYEYLKYTDILITDYSSILFDFLLLDKPIIFSCFDLEEYLNKRGFRFDYDSITPGVKTNNWSEVIDELLNIIVNKKDPFCDRRKQLNSMFNYYQDSLSCLRIYNESTK